MKYKSNEMSGAKKLTKDLQIKVLSDILGKLFQAEEIELFNYGHLVEVNIKTYQHIGLDEMTLLGHLADDYGVEISDEFVKMEKVYRTIKHPVTRLNIEIMPYEHTWAKLTKKEIT